MIKLSSKLCKNENHSDISLYQVHLPKLHENILKYDRLNLYKVIAIRILDKPFYQSPILY